MQLTIDGINISLNGNPAKNVFEIISEKQQDGTILFKVAIQSSLFDNTGREYNRIDYFTLSNLKVTADLV
jgi:hypothetical protein